APGATWLEPGLSTVYLPIEDMIATAIDQAVRLANSEPVAPIPGEYYSRFWKERQLTADSWFQDDKYIYIPASAFSNVLYEMFKI
ncbi:hypothetical protein ONQ62_26515, partial [Salmonella enterica subsp. enterica serovar Virginia]|nr:hypothetical protein [Salmonella enterica subsp. enterica serovar Virginia]